MIELPELPDVNKVGLEDNIQPDVDAVEEKNIKNYLYYLFQHDKLAAVDINGQILLPHQIRQLPWVQELMSSENSDEVKNKAKKELFWNLNHNHLIQLNEDGTVPRDADGEVITLKKDGIVELIRDGRINDLHITDQNQTDENNQEKSELEDKKPNDISDGHWEEDGTKTKYPWGSALAITSLLVIPALPFAGFAFILHPLAFGVSTYFLGRNYEKKNKKWVLNDDKGETLDNENYLIRRLKSDTILKDCLKKVDELENTTPESYKQQIHDNMAKELSTPKYNGDFNNLKKDYINKLNLTDLTEQEKNDFTNTMNNIHNLNELTSCEKFIELQKKTDIENLYKSLTDKDEIKKSRLAIIRLAGKGEKDLEELRKQALDKYAGNEALTKKIQEAQDFNSFVDVLVDKDYNTYQVAIENHKKTKSKGLMNGLANIQIPKPNSVKSIRLEEGYGRGRGGGRLGI